MTGILRGAFFALISTLFIVNGARAQGTYTAASCNQSDVNAVINGSIHTAVNGDTINIPAGTCTWTSGITVPSGVGISIIGSGSPNSGASTFGAGASTTTILDNAGSAHLFYFTPTYGASLSRVSLLTLSPASGVAQNSMGAPLAFQGTCTSSGCPNIRVDNLTFPGTPSWDELTEPSATVIVTDNVFGVLDHNTATETNAVDYYEFVNFNNSAWQGTGNYGDNSWASADTLGTNQALYVENNSFTQTGNGLFPVTETEGGFGITAEGGGRVVCRFNQAVGLRSMCVNHGTESNGRPRGGRQMEFYANSMSCPSSSYTGCFNNDMLQGAGPRSGLLYAVGNSFTWPSGTGINHFASISEYRALQNISGPWEGCDGTGPYDDNDPTIYYTGTISSVSGSNPYTVTVSGSPGWTTSQWVNNGAPYSLHDSTQNNGSEITANTSNTLTVDAWTSIPYASSDSITIRRAYVCIDESGRGGSGATLLSGATPSLTGWVNEPLDPVYEAADTSSGTPVFGPVSTDTGRIIANRDYYAEVSQSAQSSSTSPFNGTAGTGFGTLANRPATCTQGTAYWATDQGNWNSSSSTFPGQTWTQGELFICGASGWSSTPSYIPYTYPHPLITGVDPLNPPTAVGATAH